MKRISLLLLLLVLACNSVRGATINVPNDHPTIQAGIDAAVNGDTVLIHPGTYIENINFKGKTIVVGSLYLTTNDESYVSSTIIDADMKAPVVLFESNETREAQLVGLTLQNGWCGIKVNSLGPTLKKLIVKNNGAIYGGSGFEAGCNGSLNFLITDCIFEKNNHAGYVINVCNIHTSGNYYEIKNTKVINNQPSYAAIRFDGNKASIQNCLIVGNTGYGIGIVNAELGVEIGNCTIANNTKEGIYILYNNIHASIVNVTNSILWNNGEHEIGVTDLIPATIFNVSYTILKNGIDGILSQVTSVVNYGENNITSNPLFVDSAAGDYRLLDSSPCIGAGTLINDTPTVDIEGNLRPSPAGSKPDIGAYENALASPIDGLVDIYDLVLVASQFGGNGVLTGDVNKDGVVDIFDLVQIASHFGLNKISESGAALIWDVSKPQGIIETDSMMTLDPFVAVSSVVGTDLEISIKISQGSNIAGYQFTLEFDDTALEYVSIVNADFLPAGAFAMPKVNGNSVTLVATSLAGGANGDGTLAKATFKVLRKSNSVLRLSGVKLSDPGVTAIASKTVVPIHLSPGWNMISIPGVPQETDPATLQTADNSLILPLYRWNSAAFSYEPVTELKLGEGYWALTINPEGTTLQIPVASANSYSQSLTPGWNMIGSVSKAADFTDPKDDPDNSIIAGTLYSWDAARFTYEGVTQIEPGKGYWALTMVECQLTVTGSGSLAAPQPLVKLPELMLPIVLQTDHSSKDLVIGMDEGASLSLDGFDQLMPPVSPMKTEIEAYFDRDKVDWNLQSDIQPLRDRAEWQLVVRSEETTDLSVDTSTLPEAYQLIVVTGTNQYEMENKSKIRLTGEEVILRLQPKRTIPAETVLMPNYPNPFNPETWIPYHLSQDAKVVIRIYDVRGRIVRTLDVGFQSFGYYANRDKAAYWDGKTDIGEMVSSGAYFYQIQAGDYADTRKMVILK